MVNQDSALPPSLDRADLEAVLRPFGESRMLPRDAYVDEAVLAWELEHFFSGGWMCVARSEDLKGPGDQRAEKAGTGGVLLVREADGSVAGFINACRHRGHELLPCGGNANARHIQCPYHAWTYGLDGSLRVAPGFRGRHSFDPAEFGLLALPTAEWHGWIFVDQSGRAGPLASHLGGLDEIVGPYAPEELRVAGRHEYEVHANWKILTENYQECYHCLRIHPELCLVSPPDSGANYDPSGAWAGGWMELRDGAETMSLDGHSTGTMLAGLDQVRLRQIVYLAVFPNLLISLHPDYVMTHRLTPLTVDRTWIECVWSFPAGATQQAGFDPSYAVDFWDITNRQDWLACESVQRGISAPGTLPGPLSPEEDGVYHFESMVARRYLMLPANRDDYAADQARSVSQV
jgi:glycine betaine catabolism A